MDERVDDVRVPVPVPRSPMPADLVMSFEGRVRGRVVVLSTLERVVEEQRWVCWTDVFVVDGDPFVSVVREREWWAHELLGARPTEVLRWPAGAAFVA